MKRSGSSSTRPPRKLRCLAGKLSLDCMPVKYISHTLSIHNLDGPHRCHPRASTRTIPGPTAGPSVGRRPAPLAGAAWKLRERCGAARARPPLPTRNVYGECACLSNSSGVTSGLTFTEMVPRASSSRSALIFAAWLLIGGGFVVMAIALPRGGTQTVIGDILLCVLPLVANACLLSNADTTYRRTNTFWILLAAGCGLWLVGTLLWTYRELVLHLPTGYSYIGDMAYFIHPVPLWRLWPYSRTRAESARRFATASWTSLFSP